MEKLKMVSEWCYEFDIEDLEDGPVEVHLEADEQQCRALAQRYAVEAVEFILADLKLKSMQGGTVIDVQGRFKAKVIQACVVSGEPVVSELSEEFEAWFGNGGSTISLAKAKQKREEMKGHNEFEMLDEAEDPEPIVNGVIDLGELVAQHVSLSISPYPRAGDSYYENEFKDNAHADFTFKNPFAALKEWKDKLS